MRSDQTYRPPRRLGARGLAVATAALVALGALAACSSNSDSSSGSDTNNRSGSNGAQTSSGTQPAGATQTSGGTQKLTVWVDTVRTPGVTAYQKAHPEVDLDIQTIPKTPGYLQTKIGLAKRSNSGMPDVVFLNSPSDIAALASDPLDYAAPLDDLIDSATKSGFADGALAGCTFDGKVYCLRNDIGQVVLWYNKTLMSKFGYQVPTTWAQYQALGEQVAKEHPGYVIGDFGGSKFGADIFFVSSGCPTRDVTASKTVRINTSDPTCTRVADMLQPLVKNKSVSTLDQADPAFAKLGAEDKILMMPGASWYGDFLFKPTYKTPNGELAAAPLPTWPGDDQPYTSSVGGGMYAIYNGDKGAKLTAAYNLIKWLTTDADYQKSQPTYPAYTPAAEAWCQAKATDSFYAEDPCPVLKQEASLLRKTQGMISFAPEWVDTFNQTVVSAARSGKSMTGALSQWGEQLKAAAKNAGYQVTS